MGGTSYTLTPLNTLRIIAASSIFGEPQYYLDTGIPTHLKNISKQEYSILKSTVDFNKTSTDVFTTAIDNALDFDFKATLDLAVELREKYFMRLNPAVIFVRASQHKDRVKFNNENPGYMKKVGFAISRRPDDIKNQFDYFMYINKSKKGLPSCLKRTWRDTLESYSRYQLNKYKSKSIIDLVRISHASNNAVS